jgi:hypothetical protein
MQGREQLHERDLTQAAWLEWKVGLSDRGVMVAQPRPPKWFVDEECGFGSGEGPSLRWTCSDLARSNSLALARLPRDDRPDRVTYPRDFEDKRRPARARRERPRRWDRRERAAAAARLIASALGRAPDPEE